MKPLFFIHVTKTAGGTLKRMIRESGMHVQFHYPGEDGFSRNFAYAPDVEMIYGHFRFGTHAMMGADPNYACFVRDPVERAISHFHHLKNVAKNHAGERARKFGDIGTFLRQTRNLDLDNLQTRMLSGIGRDLKYKELDQSAVDRAVENLTQHFRFIGVFEALEASLDALGELFPSLAGHAGLPHVNKGNYAADIDAETLALLQDHTRLDQQVYTEAVRLAGLRA